MSEGHLLMFRQKTCIRASFALNFSSKVICGDVKRCFFRKDTPDSSGNLTDHCRMILFTNKEENKLTKQAFDTIIVPEMNRDEITKVVKNNEFILTVWEILTIWTGAEANSVY